MLQMGAHAILTICFCRVSKLGSGNKTLSWIFWSKIQDVQFCFNLYVFFRFLKLLSSASMAMVGSFQPFFDKQSLYSVSLDRAWAFWLPSTTKVPEHHGN